jgi:hypothetical protein
MIHCIEKASDEENLEFETNFAFGNSDRQSSIHEFDSEDEGKDL